VLALSAAAIWLVTAPVVAASAEPAGHASHEGHHASAVIDAAGSQADRHHGHGAEGDAIALTHGPTTGTWLDFFTNNGLYMPRTHCLMTAEGKPDWPWIIGLIVLTSTIVIGYARIFWFWAMSYRAEKTEDRNNKLMDLAYIFLWCAVCGYGMSLLIFFWPGYRLLAVFLVVLNVFTWRFILSLGDLKVSLSAKRYKRELEETLRNRAVELERLVVQRTADLSAAREEMTKLAAIAENTAHAVVMTDVEGRVTWINRSFSRITGYDADEVVGKKPGAVLQGPDTDPKTVANIREAVRRRKAISTELLNYRKDGRPYWLRLEIRPMRSDGGELTGFMAIETDVTKTKRIEDQLREAKNEAEAASRAKSDFLASMSHEIRTPLNAIIGSMDLLSDTPMQAEQRHLLGIADSSSATLLSIINDILDFSKIEAGKLDLDATPFDAARLIEEAAEIVANKADASGVDLYCEVDPPQPLWVVGDPTRLRQVVLNLLSNAVKFTEQGHVRVSIAAETDEQQDGQASIRIAVEDTGIGIAADRLETIFESFAQGDTSTTRRFGGTGLGLAISRRLVAAMGGRVDIDSEVGRGSTFTVRVALPRAEAPVRDRDCDLMVRRVLVADENELNRSVIAHHLRRWGLEVVETDTLAGLTQAVTAGDPSRPVELIILNESLGDRDCFDCLEAVRASMAGDPPPTIIASSMSTSIPQDDRARHGIIASLNKPILPSQLYNVLAGIGRENASVIDPEASAMHDQTTATPLDVLVIDDNRVNRIVAERTLERLGHACTTARSAREGIEAVRTARYDLVLMDCHMPEMDGYEATRALRKLQAEGAIDPTFIVALTANAMSSDRQRCLDAGMDDYLAKPFRRDALKAVLDRAASRQASRAASAEPQPCSTTTTPKLAPPSPTEPNPREAIPMFDQEELLERCMKDRDLAVELLADWDEAVGQSLRELASAIGDEDADAVRGAAHAIKGSSLEVAAAAVAESAAKIEDAARQGTLDGLRAEMDELVATIENARTQSKTLSETLNRA
jgi:PAS domain S-box-containing protein